MISSIIDLVLISALGVTSICVLLMYRRLKRFDALQGDAAKAFAAASEALEQARYALYGLQSEGDVMAVALANRLNEARMVINDLDRSIMSRPAVEACETPAPPAMPRRAPPAEPGAGAPRQDEPRPLACAPQPAAEPGTAQPTRWTPPGAKIKAVAASNQARRAAAAEASPHITWSSLSEAAANHTAH